MLITSSFVLPTLPLPSTNHGFIRLRSRNSLPPWSRFSKSVIYCSSRKTLADSNMDAADCPSTGNDVENSDVEQLLPSPLSAEKSPKSLEIASDSEVLDKGLVSKVLEWVFLVSPFFFWGTSMVAMKEVIPKTGPFFVAAFRLIPAGAILIGIAAATGRRQPAGLLAWISILLFGAVDGACFQGFLAQGLQRISAGLGSVIIDSQPLTVSILAALLFGESIGAAGAAGLVLGVIGLLLLEVPSVSLKGTDLSIWGSGEWWMLLAAQSMAVGTVMVRWVSKYSDPIMATGWHMIIGGLPLLIISALNHDPVLIGNVKGLSSDDVLALVYTSVFGSAISYGVFFYNATRGSLTKLSSLTFLTPVFASIFGFFYLGETFSPPQLFGALVTLFGIYLVNYKVGKVDDV
ncbi:hypothetical protein HPP92_021881 [Vanilla planifolia]|uniref:EamA domain-containing protein n=1 Tax=Vanilla planifolia TaxID=51239 RepID=A0A835UEX2_VANPL|nr:hypothetical protein HPP92_022205 [Vanilla planifolia]KAG0458753.1 hypothetical protein HPP92_021881 [Vanilla planifolia]